MVTKHVTQKQWDFAQEEAGINWYESGASMDGDCEQHENSYMANWFGVNDISEIEVTNRPLYIEQVSATASPIVKGTRDAACWDLCADLLNPQNPTVISYNGFSYIDNEVLVVPPSGRVLVPTGYKMCCESGYVIEYFPRSGISFKRGLSFNNAVSQIDADYRGECFVSVLNTSSSEYLRIKHGEAIAQMRLTKLQGEQLVFGELPPTSSNRNGGFGSTDK